MRALAEVFPENGIVVLEARQATIATAQPAAALEARLVLLRRRRRPGLSGSAPRSACRWPSPQRPVVCVVGEGSAQYAIQSLWSAAAYEVPITILVLRNEGVRDPQVVLDAGERRERSGLDLPKLDVSGVAEGYGVRARRVENRDELTSALRDAIASGKPAVVEGTGRAGIDAGLMDLLAPDATRIGLPEGAAAADDRVPESLAGGTPETLRSDLIAEFGFRARARADLRPSCDTRRTRARTG